MTEVKQHRDVPASAPPVQHNSGHIRTTPAGGQVLPDQYRQPAPAPEPRK